MADISISATDAVVLVYSLAEPETFEEVAELRAEVLRLRGPDTPIVVAANKCDLGPQLHKEEFKVGETEIQIFKNFS